MSWFRETPNAILTSVGILTTGFDEPTVKTIIINRATRSLTLYHQMIGRGSRKLPEKDAFSIIDLGNNVRRFGYWQDYINWQDAFRFPDRFLESRVSELEDMEFEIEFEFKLNIFSAISFVEIFLYLIENSLVVLVVVFCVCSTFISLNNKLVIKQ